MHPCMDWVRLDQDFQGSLWIGLDRIGSDDCDHVSLISNHWSTVDGVSFKL